MMSRATQSELLERRIAENAAAQQIDLAAWIFERIRVRDGDQVLELCCGTGGQTLPLLERVGAHGRVVALDISKTALDVLASKAGAKNGENLTCVEASLEDVASSLTRAGVRRAGAPQAGFDLVFCAYGLYYSSDVDRTLAEARSFLNPEGRIVIVGPYGPNNKPLFDLLRASGVVLAEPVVFSSESFMLQMVLPWATQHFESVSVHTMVNPVSWTAPERVLNYWQSTTFYDAEKREDFERLVHAHFAKHPALVNEKWVMLVEMSHARS
jgi:ubiquinone/menaquinone biosynthesis C-methylase UbiE